VQRGHRSLSQIQSHQCIEGGAPRDSGVFVVFQPERGGVPGGGGVGKGESPQCGRFPVAVLQAECSGYICVTEGAFGCGFHQEARYPGVD